MPPLQAQVTRPEGWWTVTVPMAERDRAKAEAAVGQAPYALRNAAALFDLIHMGLAGGWLEDGWLIAVAETAAHSFGARVESDSFALEQLHVALKRAADQEPPAEGEAA